MMHGKEMARVSGVWRMKCSARFQTRVLGFHEEDLLKTCFTISFGLDLLLN